MAFLQFYEHLEPFYKLLIRDSSRGTQQFEPHTINMETIWIYVYIFVGATCFNCLVFLCENLFFRRKKVLNAVEYAIKVVSSGCRKAIAFGWMYDARMLILQLRFPIQYIVLNQFALRTLLIMKVCWCVQHFETPHL